MFNLLINFRLKNYIIDNKNKTMEVSNNEANTGKSVCSQSTMVSQVGDEITKETLVHKAESDSVRVVGYSKDSNAVADLKAVESNTINHIKS